MDRRKRLISEAMIESADPTDKPSTNLDGNNSFDQFDFENLSFGADDAQTAPGFSTSMDPPIVPSRQTFHQDVKIGNQVDTTIAGNNGIPDWDPRTMLSNLSFLEQKIHQVQDIVRSIAKQEGRFSIPSKELAAQQQLVSADITCIIIQLISTAGSLLPSMKNTLSTASPSSRQLESIIGTAGLGLKNSKLQENETVPAENIKPPKPEEHPNITDSTAVKVVEPVVAEDHDVKDCEDGVECENLPPGSYEVLQLEKEEILAPHTHFCLICGKGFKRDANLRMHMRGHGDEYKTPAALAKPSKEANPEPVPIKRYSCPFIGCKRNKEHKKFQPLKTILCVKNHYKRSHCDKSYICSRCHSKKFSVIADLKTHEKHCGRDKWLCSCGTTFSRKDKLFGHVALFQGHTPALPVDENKASGASTQLRNDEQMAKAGGIGFDVGGGNPGDIDFLDAKVTDDDLSLFSSMNFDSCNFGGFHEFPREAFEAYEDSFPLLATLQNNYVHEAEANSTSNCWADGRN